MFILQIIRFFWGFVSFSAEGGFPERFLNLAARSRAKIWKVKKRGGKLTGYTIAKDYKLLHIPARKAGVKLRVASRTGLPFFIHRYKKRFGLFFGALLFVLIIYFLSKCVWSINITGNHFVSETQIRSVLKEYGLSNGSVKSKINENDISQELIINIPDLAWASIYIKGSVAEVEVREKVKKPEIIPQGTPCNIIAAKEGKILELEVFEGKREVMAGDSVPQGKLLVSGTIENKLLETVLVHSKAKVIAETEYVIEVKVPYKSDLKKVTGKSYNRRSLNFFSLSLPMYMGRLPKGEYEVNISDNDLSLFDTLLPVGVKTERYHLLKNENVTLTKEEAQNLAAAQGKLREIEELASIQIIGKNTSIETDGESCVYKCVYKCREDISKEQPIELTDENGQKN